MAVPRNRLSNSRKNTKRAHHAKKPKNTLTCSNCNSIVIPHVMCHACGFYGDRVVVNPKAE